MEKKFSKTGVYVVEIKDLKKNERIYKDKNYTYNLYFYNTKKAFEKAEKKNVFEKDFLQDECFDVLPSNRENMKFYDANSKKYINYDKFLKKEPKLESYDENKFYCVVLDNTDVDSLVFFNEEYKQSIYEFSTKEELDIFINEKENKKKPIDQKTSSLLNYKKDNIVYLLRKDNKQKVLDYDYILDEKDFSVGKNIDSWNDERFITKVVFFPSGDAYIFNCHEDAITEAVMNLSRFIEEEISIERFIDGVEEFYSEKHEFKFKYIGKDSDFKFERTGSHDESIFLISNYLNFDIIWQKEEIEYLKNMLNLENKFINDLNDMVKKNPKEAVEKAKELLISMQIIDNDGRVMEPYTKVFYKDDSIIKGNNKRLSKKQ